MLISHCFNKPIIVCSDFGSIGCACIDNQSKEIPNMVIVIFCGLVHHTKLVKVIKCHDEKNDHCKTRESLLGQKDIVAWLV